MNFITLSEWLKDDPSRSIDECWCSADGDFVAFATKGGKVTHESHGDSPKEARELLLRRLDIVDR